MDFAFNSSLAVLLLRTVTGVLFFFQGYDKIFNVKINNVVRTFGETDALIRLRPTFLKPLIALSSMVELVAGLLLFFGWYRNISLYCLAADLLVVAIMFSLIKPMWDMQHFFPRMLFIILLLVIPPSFDAFSLDYIIFKH